MALSPPPELLSFLSPSRVSVRIVLSLTYMSNQIWESNGKPHHYQMTAKYYSKPRDSQPAIHRYPEEAPALFDRVFDHFKRFFRKKTGIDWDERLVKAGSQPKKYWQYKPPVSSPCRPI